VPKIAQQVGHLDVYQRTPIWVGPKPNVAIPGPARMLLRRIPGLHRVVRRLAVALTELLLVFMTVHYKLMRWLPALGSATGRGWYAAQVKDPETRKALFPDYTIGCKRPSVSNDYLRTFNRENVELVTTPIERVTPSGVRTTDGEVRPVDVLILATGFRMAYDPENFRRTPVRGRDGVELADVFQNEPLKAYEGISLPEFPNQFMIFGPYGWIGGTWHQLVETAAEHVVRVILEARSRGAAGVEVREEAATQWTAEMRKRVAGSLWIKGNCATANSYYYDHHGDPTFLRPTSSTRAVRATRRFPMSDYRFWGIVVPPRVSGSAQVTGR
jgi:cation diffusion facilitator CzcD-associated flavoprotein CzcO